MDRLTDFRDQIRLGYSPVGESIVLGGAMLDGECVSDCLISVPMARPSADKGTLETIMDSTVTRQIGRTVAREVTRGILGVFGLGGRTIGTTRRQTRRRPSWF